MYWLGVLLVSPTWGMISTQLFVQSWLAFIGFIMNIIGLLKGTVPRNQSVIGLSVSLFSVVLFSALLSLGFWLLTKVFHFGATTSENVLYWIFAVFSLIYMIPEFLQKVKKLWRNATIEGSLEADVLARKVSRYK